MDFGEFGKYSQFCNEPFDPKETGFLIERSDRTGRRRYAEVTEGLNKYKRYSRSRITLGEFCDKHKDYSPEKLAHRLSLLRSKQ